VLAIPVAQPASLDAMRAFADSVVCLHAVRRFAGVGAFYVDFHQLSDDETIGLLRREG
jgi:predicted phosphoribosyltransferase